MYVCMYVYIFVLHSRTHWFAVGSFGVHLAIVVCVLLTCVCDLLSAGLCVAARGAPPFPNKTYVCCRYACVYAYVYLLYVCYACMGACLYLYLHLYLYLYLYLSFAYVSHLYLHISVCVCFDDYLVSIGCH